MWDVTTGAQLAVLGNSGKITSVAYSSSGTTILVGLLSSRAHRWSLNDDDCDWRETRQDVAWQLFVKYYPIIRNSRKSRVLSFTEAINLDDDSQKECSIQ
ncbi:hypothetical protein H0W26_01115 [Candidatus Dependentiae bacterium]|nr:hypothetical protein [Candidatus Dependentiae bacterium]